MITLNIFQLLLIIGLANAVILFFSFTRIRNKYRKPALYLGLFIIAYLIYSVDYVVVPIIEQQLSIYLPKIPALLFIPPLFLFFVKSAFEPDFKITGLYKWVLGPGLVDIFYQLFVWWYVYIQAIRSGALYHFFTGRAGHFTYEGSGILLSLICVGYLLTDFLKSFKRTTDSFKFFRYTIAGLVIILLRWIIMYFIDLFAPGSYDITLQYYFWIFDSAFLLYTGYKILTVPKILDTNAADFTLPEDMDPQKYSDRLKEILHEKKLYLDKNLSRKDLADELGLSEVYISSILKEGLDSGFYETINRYRVEEAVQMIEEGKLGNLTVEALAGEVGFKSKSTFNKAFKRFTGTTPASYPVK